MSVKINLRPKKGLIIRDPKTLEALPENGKLVKSSTYWLRRLKCGDVEKVIEKKKTKQVKEPIKDGEK